MKEAFLPDILERTEMKTKNVTLSIEEDLIAEGRLYAQKNHTSLNSLIRDMLAKTVLESSGNWAEECFLKMDAASGHSGGSKWKREELYGL